MASPPVELDPELAEKEEWEAAELAATIAAFERHKLEEETEEWEAAGLLALEQYERTSQWQASIKDTLLHRVRTHYRMLIKVYYIT